MTKIPFKNFYKQLIPKFSKMVKSVSKKVESKGIPYDLISYVLGIVALVEAFVSPVTGFVLSIIGLTFSRREASALSTKGKRLNTIALVVGALLLILTLVFYLFDFSSFAGTSGL